MKPTKPLLPPTMYLEHPEHVDVVEEDTDPDIPVPEDITQVTRLCRSLDEVLQDAEKAAQAAEKVAERTVEVLRREDGFSNLKRNLSTPPPRKK